jgi:hypothetical protein
VRRLQLLTATLAVLLTASTASAEGLLRITPTGWSVEAWNAAHMPVDPVPIGSTGFRLSFHGGSDQTVIDPVLLILGLPTTTPAPAAPLLVQTSSSGSAVAPFNPLLGITLGGPTPYSGTPYAPTGWDPDGIRNTPYNASVGNLSVYEFLGLQLPNAGGSESENYPNWSGTGGVASWNLFVYQLTFAPDFNRGEWVEFGSSWLPPGSYVVGYGIEPPDKTQESNINATPFTFAVHTTDVPEPATSALLFGGLAVLAAVRRRTAA